MGNKLDPLGTKSYYWRLFLSTNRQVLKKDSREHGEVFTQQHKKPQEKDSMGRQGKERRRWLSAETLKGVRGINTLSGGSLGLPWGMNTRGAMIICLDL